MIIDVAIIGAGPYGLSAAAHLQRVRGLDVRLIGEPMAFWERHMPAGMLLRSRWEASHLSDPDHKLSLDAFKKLEGRDWLGDPLPAKEFIEYGRWFHARAGLAADPRKVLRVEIAPKGYQLELESGEPLRARRVVIAAGIQSFAYRPPEFEGLPASLASHSSDFRDFAKFRGKKVLVIGGGQSALEAASFLVEADADAEMLIRRPRCVRPARFQWLPRGKWSRLLYGHGDVGPAGISLIVQRPNLFRCFPQSVQQAWDRRSHKTGFSYRHVPVKEVPICWGRCVTEARIDGDSVHCVFNDQSRRRVDHIILATGYRVNVALYDFLSPRIIAKLALVEGYPKLDGGLESSLAGLHFLGTPAALSFGPLVRFVAGSEFLARALARRIRRAEKGRVKERSSRLLASQSRSAIFS